MSAPSRLGRYPVRRRIGSGAFATVWLAYDEHLDSPVAIKVLAENWTGDLHIRQRFLEEGRFLRKVESPHVVTVYDAGELDDERPYLVMAYADQGTLADRLELSALEPSQALTVVHQVGAGLAALHDRGVLHRDVKPANVLFRSVERAVGSQVVAMVGDLGLGKAMDMSSRLTMVGGTPTYVAPEQALGEGLDPRADQFSLAALTYYLLSGRQPFRHASLAAAENPAPPPPMGLDNPEAEAVVLKALSKDRGDRYDDVECFTAALVEAMGGHLDEAPEAWMPEDPELTDSVPIDVTAGATDPEGPASGRRHRRWPLVVAAAAVLAAGAGAGWGIERAATSERTVEDRTGTLAVTVPEAWTVQVDPEQWTPLDGKQEQPSIASGTRAGWSSVTDPAPGVFVGLLPGEKLPTRVPQHNDCTGDRVGPIRDTQDGDDSMTMTFTGCPGPDVTVERVVQVNSSQLLWIQIRSDDRATANRVLDSVQTFGV
ncbi:Serine/threonine protein kinase [Nocardioides exalbidus]|uniref:non-specific serine/threonine protein kinase n=1 Tax=Nocardioides exalbidus TaxID=402596 RepID=A0A1H4MMJ8_9ACTN|nr:serine/threonine-protein kinase [Nocardioides exalbidus]SEB84291.1 Serine/threonine protein kinase [Nocardioides exalbidus]